MTVKGAADSVMHRPVFPYCHSWIKVAYRLSTKSWTVLS